MIALLIQKLQDRWYKIQMNPVTADIRFHHHWFFCFYDFYSSHTRPHSNGANLSLWHHLVWFWVDPLHFTYTPLWQTHSSEVTYVGRSTATQPSDSVNEVLLHLSAETHAGHQLLQQLAVLHLKEGRHRAGNAMAKLVKETHTPSTLASLPLYLCMCPSGVHCSSLSHHHGSICHTPHDFRSWTVLKQLLWNHKNRNRG